MAEGIAEVGQLSADELDPTGALAAFAAAQHREYNTYVALGPIYAGGALAYNKDHPVPISNVARHGYLANGLVGLAPGAEHAAECMDQVPVGRELETGPADPAVSESPNDGASTESVTEPEEN